MDKYEDLDQLIKDLRGLLAKVRVKNAVKFQFLRDEETAKTLRDIILKLEGYLNE